MEKKKNGAPHRDFRKNDKNNDRHDRTPRRDFKKELRKSDTAEKPLSLLIMDI